MKTSDHKNQRLSRAIRSLSLSILSLSIVTLVTFTASSALAHPGHGVDQAHPWSVAHYLGSPLHATIIVFGLALVGYLAFRLFKLRRKAAESKPQK